MRRAIALLGVAGLATLFTTVPSAHAATTTLQAGLSALNEVPTNASGATGTSTVTIDDVTNQVCISTAINGISLAAITAAHIHSGAAGVNGPPIVDFLGSVNTCVTTTPANVSSILATPASFYVNVHTVSFPLGQVRGQLGQGPPPTTTTTGGSTTSTSSTTTTTSFTPTTSTPTTTTPAVATAPRLAG